MDVEHVTPDHLLRACRDITKILQRELRRTEGVTLDLKILEQLGGSDEVTSASMARYLIGRSEILALVALALGRALGIDAPPDAAMIEADVDRRLGRYDSDPGGEQAVAEYIGR